MSDSDSDDYYYKKQRRHELLNELWRQESNFHMFYDHALQQYEKKKNNEYIKKSKLIKKFLDIKLPIISNNGYASRANRYENYAYLSRKVNLLLMNYPVDLI